MSELWHSAVSEYSADEMSMDEYFEHWGIKGMKWGVRRYQNPDGSLTAAGKARYGSGADGVSQNHDIRKLTTAAKEDVKRGKRIGNNVANAGLGGLTGAGGAALLSSIVTGGSILAAPVVAGAVGGIGVAIAGKAIGRGVHIASRKIAQFIKDRRTLKNDAPSVDEVNKLTGQDKEQVKERRKAETKCLAKAVEGGTFGKKVLDYIDSKMSKQTKKNVLEFDEKLKGFRDKFDMASNSDKRKMNLETVSTMQHRAREMLLDMGWAPTEQNIYYLTQIVWGNEYV